MKILMAAGSSGGHIFPAIATAFRLKELNSYNEILFVGSKKGLDKEIFRNEGYSYYAISENNQIFKDLFSSFLLLRRFKPDIAVGFGGYVSFPILLMAKMLSVPTMTHEQNLFPGLANRVLSKVVDKIAVSFNETNNFFAKKSVIEETGNPIRSSLVKLDKQKALKGLGLSNEKCTILVMGGSQGAHFINEIVLDTLRDINKTRGSQFQVIHLSGMKDFEFVRTEYKSMNIENRVFSFFDMMSQPYSASDFVISRAGATSIAELTFFGKPAILIPYPSVKVHQIENARFLEENGAAILVEQMQLSKGRLKEIILDLMDNGDKLRTMSKNSSKLSRPDAAHKLALEILNVVKS